MIVAYITLALLVLGIGIYVWLFYPQQLIDPETIQQVDVTTPEEEKYHNDVLHPCIRRMSDGRYVMVQSPWYRCQDGIENPILYISDDPMKWDNGIVVEDTPVKGYNSDPNVFVEGNRIYVFWRECFTQFCEEHGVQLATVGKYTDDGGKTFSEKKIYLANNNRKIDNELCPIMIKIGDKYRFYCCWYNTDYSDRHNLGVAIWEGCNLENPNFRLLKTVPFESKYICDKYKQLKLFGHIFFIPIPHKFDLWHFDLLVKEGKLYMFASEEMGDVEMMAVSDDWEHFRLNCKPLINAHYMENIVKYRQEYYKPTAFLADDGRLNLFYTANLCDNLYIHRLFCIKI